MITSKHSLPLAPALSLIVPVALILLAHATGLFIAFGAHPSWSLSGAGIGLAIGFAMLAGIATLRRFGRISELLLAVLFGSLALVAAILMLNGKETYAASFAEDALAGRFWHFGYIGFVAALFAALVNLGLAFAARR